MGWKCLELDRGDGCTHDIEKVLNAGELHTL